LDSSTAVVYYFVVMKIVSIIITPSIV
jgi:hypothetical protein